MATINGIQGSPLFGSPINVSITAASPTGNITFHQIKIIVTARLQNGIDKDYLFRKPVSNGQTILTDISSVLTSAFRNYTYTAEPPEYYPYVVFQVKANDEYVLNGETYTTPEASYGGQMRALAGAYSDLERMIAGENKVPLHFTRKPSTLPEVVAVGETHIRPDDMSVTLSNISHGQNPMKTEIKSEGLVYANGIQVYAVPASRDRYEFRFINGLGCMESLSVCCLRKSEVNVDMDQQVITRHETFGTFSHGAVYKQNDYEKWSMNSGPLDEAWQSWYIHEFLMTEHAWIKVGTHWLPVRILQDEAIGGIDRANPTMLMVDFNIQFDIAGSVLSALAI